MVSTSWFSKTVGFWNLRPIPSSAISASSRFVRSTVPAKIDLALVGSGLARDDIHHGGLAGPIGADDGAHLVRRQNHGEAAQRLVAVERDANVIEVEQRRGQDGVRT